MKPVPSKLMPFFLTTIESASVPKSLKGAYCKWLRFYLDFCAKYKHPPRDPDSLEPFLQKLASKNQSPAAQKQAANSISLYYETMKNWKSANQAGQKVSERTSSLWDAVYRDLKNEIRVRQYSPKTLSTYRIWIEQFQKYIRSKPPE